jgi:hypothetical protein
MADLDIQALLNQANKDRAANAAARMELDKAALNKKLTQEIKTSANNKFLYADTIDKSRLRFEDLLRQYAIKITRGDKLSVVEEKDFQRTIVEYNKVNTAYHKAIADGNAILKKSSQPITTPLSEKLNKPKTTSETIDPNVIVKDSTYTSNPQEWAKQFEITNTGVQQGATGAYIINLPGPKPMRPGSTIVPEDDVQSFASAIEARNAYLNAYASGPGQIDKLKQQLLAGNWIKKSDLTNDGWISGLDDMIARYSIHVMSQLKYEGKSKADTIQQFLGGTGKGGFKGSVNQAGTFNVPKTDITTKGDAFKEINSFMLDAIGREATVEEKDAFFKEINKRELASSVTRSATYDSNGRLTKESSTGAYVQLEERNAVATNIILGALNGTTAEAIQASSKGSKIAVDISALQNNSALYGHSLTPGEALKMVMEGYGQKDYLAKQTERMRLNAMTVFGNLKQHIMDGGNVKDITDVYAKLKMNKLGIVIPDSLTDKDVMDAVTKTGGMLSTADFTRQMQANPLWRQTEEAHNTTADFANTILKSFGFMG